MQIRAAVLEEFANPLVVQDVELEGPKPGEVLVRLAACGVCHTDLYTASGADPSGYAPTVLGHEGAGVVEDVGEGNLVSNQTIACCPAASQDGLVAMIDFEMRSGRVRAQRVRYVPTWVRHPDMTVLRATPGSASWHRTVSVAGRRPGIRPAVGQAAGGARGAAMPPR